jgi:type II secretion system protein N
MSRKALLPAAGYILFFLCLTLVFSVLNYPKENLTGAVNGWLSEVSDRTIRVESASLKLPLSMKLENVVLDIGENGQILGDAVISPGVLAFLTGKRSIKGKLEGPWGVSRFRARISGDSWSLNVGSLEMDLSEAPLVDDLPFEFDGDVKASLELEMADPSNDLVDGRGRLSGTGMEVQGDLLEALDLSPLRFSSLAAVFTIEDNVLTVGENGLEGDIFTTARGTIRLIPGNPMNSRVDLILDVKPGSETKGGLSTLFAFIGGRPRADGGVSLRIKGTIKRPSITS